MTEIQLLWVLICMCYFGIGGLFISSELGRRLTMKNTILKIVLLLIWPIGILSFIVTKVD